MKRFQSILGGVVINVALIASAAAQLSQGEKDTVFIGPVKVNESVEASAKKSGHQNGLNQLAEGLRTQLVTEINQTRVFQIVERERKDDIEVEQAFAQVAVDPNDKNAAQMMRMKGAKYAFLPRIDAFEDRSSTTKYEAIQRKDVSRAVWVSAVLSIVDTTTGALLPESPSVKVKSSNSLEYARMGAGLGGDELINQVTKELAEKLAQEVVTMMRPAKVLTVTGSQIMINRGTEAGFDVGSEIEFFATEDVKDEDTGEVFKNEISVGKGVVKRSDAKQSFAEAKGENLGIAKGCIVRVLKKGTTATAAAKKRSPEKITAGSDEKPLTFN
jgi:curli biogenesis system outer membrane secretion channel CsgG